MLSRETPLVTDPRRGPLTAPFVVTIDTREQLPYAFAGLLADADQQRRPLVVPTSTVTLRQGDYSIVGCEARVAVERKSVEDLFGTLGGGRGRFERELGRLAGLAWAAVVVEAGWAEVLGAPPVFSRLRPKTIHRSVIAWQQRYPMIHWWFVEGRRLGEITTYRILERWWKESRRTEANTACGTAGTD